MDLPERRFVLDYDSAVAMRYHAERRGFCERMARTGTALSLIFGGGAFAAVIAGPDWAWVAKWTTLVVALVNALNLAFGTADAGRKHADLYQKWAALRAELVKVGSEDKEEIERLEVQRAKLDADTPTQLHVLSVYVENEEKKVRGEGRLYRIGWLAHAVRNFGSWSWYDPKEEGDAGPKAGVGKPASA